LVDASFFDCFFPNFFETRRTRTADVFGVNETLYQLSYSPFG
jgi:hypothetical protein